MKMTQLFLMTLLILSCSEHGELKPPSNPFDPSNPDYVGPMLTIIDGPGFGETIESSHVYFRWEGNTVATEYSSNLDNSGWSEWSPGHSREFWYLDEGPHDVQFKARSLNGDIQVESIRTEFIVDAVIGPALYVFPYEQHASEGDTLTYVVMAEDVVDLLAVSIHFLTTTQVEVLEIELGDITNQWGAEPLVVTEQTGREYQISLSGVGANFSSFTGSVSIVSIRMLVHPSDGFMGTVGAITFIRGRLIRNDLNEVSPVVKRGGWLYVD